ncbi:glucose-6-phosphate dehydrogenase (NADP(+)) [Candidatus Saccharibacteria bacterium]|nr:glucose-6-phosphate dehydrogenase (NADP(+)) [Candidatus Saccharibacteria bacterium]
MSQTIPSTTLVIFGVSGDLARRYLLPSLAEICQNTDIRTNLRILGISRRDISENEILDDKNPELKGIFQTFQMDYEIPDEFKNLKSQISKNPSEQVIFYFAVPPEAVPAIVTSLGEAKLNTPDNLLLMEKPFGTDLASSRKLIEKTQEYFKEEQVYRIDHYLAKEMAQNIAVFLGSNVLFRDVWHNQYIDYVEIVTAESIGIEGRVKLWESTGSLRDFLQSHLLQLAALTIMEPCPHDFDFSDLPKRRLVALKQLYVDKNDLDKTAIRAQYDGYRDEVDNPDSKAETFVALQLHSSDPRWKNVPIYLATGKKLDRKLTQIRINFKKDREAEANMLTLRIQPNEAIELDLWVKRPGYERELQKKTLSFSYEQDFEDRLPNAYEQILVDAFRGSHSLFASSEEVLESWRIIQPVIDYWQQDDSEVKQYKSGSTIEELLKNT